MNETKGHVKFLQWFAIALFLQLLYFNIFKYVNILQDILVYGAYLKSLSYSKKVTPVKKYIGIAIVLALVSNIFSQQLLFYWSTVFIAGIDLLIIMEFGKILVSLEQRYNAHGPTARVLKKYVIIVFAVIVSWTMLSNLPRDWQIGLLVLGAFLLFVVNIRLFFHVLSLRKHVKKKSFVVTYL